MITRRALLFCLVVGCVGALFAVMAVGGVSSTDVLGDATVPAPTIPVGLYLPVVYGAPTLSPTPTPTIMPSPTPTAIPTPTITPTPPLRGVHTSPPDPGLLFLEHRRSVPPPGSFCFLPGETGGDYVGYVLRKVRNETSVPIWLSSVRIVRYDDQDGVVDDIETPIGHWSSVLAPGDTTWVTGQGYPVLPAHWVTETVEVSWTTENQGYVPLQTLHAECVEEWVCIEVGWCYWTYTGRVQLRNPLDRAAANWGVAFWYWGTGYGAYEHQGQFCWERSEVIPAHETITFTLSSSSYRCDWLTPETRFIAFGLEQ